VSGHSARLVLPLVALVFGACSSKSPPSPATGGGPVAGARDAHCQLPDGGVRVQATDPAACTQPAMKSTTLRPAHDPSNPNPYGETMYNADADDDECKYHVAWTSTPIGMDTDVTFTMTLTRKNDASLAAAAKPNIEAFLDDTHPAPNTEQRAEEVSAGVYRIGPVRFDRAGVWTVRFHAYDTCSSMSPESLHGHAAFFVNVP
jgi:hypothetical protein